MIEGIFVKNIPFVRISVGRGDIVKSPNVVLDTGFTGNLQITSKTALELGIRPTSITHIKLANGKIANIPASFAFAELEGEKKYVQILISDGLPLLGIGFLSRFGYKATVDCKHKTIELEKAI